MNTVDDTEIIRRLQEGDQSVLATILKDIIPRHWRLLSRKFGEGISNEDFEDIIAVSLAKVWSKRHSFDYSKGDFSGWFYVILRNSTLDFLRRNAPKIEEILTVVPLPDTESSTEEVLEMTLKHTIANLSERERKVLSPLFESSGISIGDLSKELGISEGAIRQLRFRASQKLKRDLESVGYTIHRVRRPVGSRNTYIGDDHEPI
jgi:RNA polymerase sigma factor (sigma-70 family)